MPKTGSPSRTRPPDRRSPPSRAASGYGREHAIDTLREFTYQKVIRFPTGLAPVPQWRAVTELYGV
ncbi:hypothetical protein [Streptacidiphilus anmyonensis]|uniref:hypothetical protein n=1 Tax=Streptacidiphilus anmyonensis TaxID=405782 RepID=UPI0005AA6F78|nr:hypothetical protein [Streptacidiphilus anmyonensis]